MPLEVVRAAVRFNFSARDEQVCKTSRLRGYFDAYGCAIPRIPCPDEGVETTKE